MTENVPNTEIIKIADSKGNTMTAVRTVLKTGEVVTSTPFPNVKDVIDNMDKIQFRDDDVILASSMRSGTHWVYEMMYMILTGRASPAPNVRQKYYLELHSIEAINDTMDELRILNTHLLPKYLSKHLLKQKMVYVIRNPKSVAASVFHIYTGMLPYEYSGTFESFLPTFMAGIDTLYGSWFEHVRAWWEMASKNKKIHVVFYEDCKSNPHEEVKKLAEFLGRNLSDELIADVIRMTSIDVMREMPGKNSEARKALDGYFRDGKQQFIRKGEIAEWKNYFTVAQNEMFDRVYEQEMKGFEDFTARLRYQ